MRCRSCSHWLMTARYKAQPTQAPHLAETSMAAQEVLIALLERMGAEHPHHALWQLFALAHGNMDKLGRVMAPSDKGLQQRVDLSKVTAAGDLLKRVAKQQGRHALQLVVTVEARACLSAVAGMAAWDENLQQASAHTQASTTADLPKAAACILATKLLVWHSGRLVSLCCRKDTVDQMGSIVKAYIALAAYDAKAEIDKGENMKFPSTFARVAKSITCVSVPSETVPVHPDGDYSGVPHIAGKCD